MSRIQRKSKFHVHHLFRLNHDRHGGAWCPKPAIAEDVKEWLQVDLGAVHVVTGIVTQVREKWREIQIL